MEYIAWGDGSKKDEKVFASFIIFDKNKNIITQYKARIKGLKDINQAEYMAFYIMLKKIKELDLRDIEIYLDSQNVFNDFMNRASMKHNSYRDLILEEIGLPFYRQIVTKIKCKKRKFNKAHPLFNNKKIPCETIYAPTKERKKKIEVKTQQNNIVVSAPIKVKKEQTKKQLEKTKVSLAVNNLEGIYLSIPHTHFKIKECEFKKFQRSVRSEKYDTIEKTLNLLHKKISTSMVYSDDDKKVLVSGKLHMYVDNNVIEKVLKNATEWTTLWREKYEKDKNTPIKLKKVKEYPVGQAVILPGTKVSIENSFINRIFKSKANQEQSIEEKIKWIDTRINNSLKIKQNGYDVYIYGRFHLYVANNLVQDYKIFKSQWTALSRMSINRKEVV
jgi:ribonuclease HI